MIAAATIAAQQDGHLMPLRAPSLGQAQTDPFDPARFECVDRDKHVHGRLTPSMRPTRITVLQLEPARLRHFVITRNEATKQSRAEPSRPWIASLRSR